MQLKSWTVETRWLTIGSHECTAVSLFHFDRDRYAAMMAAMMGNGWRHGGVRMRNRRLQGKVTQFVAVLRADKLRSASAKEATCIGDCYINCNSPTVSKLLLPSS